MTDSTYHYIDRDADFVPAVERWRRSGVVGIDTEFIRTRTFYPIAALYQVATETERAIVDPLTVTQWGSFKALLEDRGVVKVMHACSEDLEVFARHLDAMPTSLFDTQIAASFLGAEYSPSYAELVRRHTGTELGKHETRSDWLARPLRAEQLRYAIEDVEFLLPIHRAQAAALERLGRTAWCQEEIGQRLGYAPVEPDLAYLNLRISWRGDRRGLARLRAMCAWRERYARDKDLPRGHVVKDQQLVELASQRSVDRETIVRVLEPPAARRHGKELLGLVEQADALPDDALPAALEAPLTTAESRMLKELKAIGAECARGLGIAEELLSRRRDLEKCLRTIRADGRLPDNFLGWRRALVGDAFAAKLSAMGR
ncbi:MAG TPA: ribonuclease D [Pseudomonadales bacterium]|nr:ribonuclease D [Pseudomonadales bacterium]